MPTRPLILTHGDQSVSFAPVEGGYRPEWFRLGDRPMLRFKDHEFLNIGALRVKRGTLLEQTPTALRFGGEELFAGVRVGWSVRIAIPVFPPEGFTPPPPEGFTPSGGYAADSVAERAPGIPSRRSETFGREAGAGGSGFLITTTLTPLQEPIELLEAMSAFELPYEYDGTEHQMSVLSQQPVYRSEGNKEITGAGYAHPFWYYGRPGRAHLTFPTQAPMMCCRVANADGSNARFTTLIGNFDVCSFKDLFAQPSRPLRNDPNDVPFPDPRLAVAPGRRGRKFLVGALNWTTSLHKDPNVLVERGQTLSQEVLVDFASEFPGGRWDTWLAASWERMAKLHFPKDGCVPAYEVARSRGASWVEAAEWLGEQFQRPEGTPGFFYPSRGTAVYAPHTRPKWDQGVGEFAGQWIGPLSYLAHVWKADSYRRAAERLEPLFAADKNHSPEAIWTIGPTPMHVSVMRKAALCGVSAPVMEKVQDYVRRRTEVVLNPPPGGRRGDAGILAWDALANLLAADLFERPEREAAARELLARVNRQLDERFESFNCAAVGDLVGAGQGRPFGHGIAMTANVLAWRRFGDPAYLDAAERCGNIMMSLYFAGYNNSESPDLDARGWAVGANGGRDQLCHLPPWETGFALQQLAHLILAGKGREGFYDLLWLFAHTGLCQFPKARALKRLYTPDLEPVYRPIDAVATERAFYLSLPYLAYEEPWDQTMLAGYQGVEPLILSLFLGGGLVAAEDSRILVLVPQAAAYDPEVARAFTVHLWNPLAEPVETRLFATVAAKRGETWCYSGPAYGEVDPEHAWTKPLRVKAREALEVCFAARA